MLWLEIALAIYLANVLTSLTQYLINVREKHKGLHVENDALRQAVLRLQSQQQEAGRPATGDGAYK